MRRTRRTRGKRTRAMVGLLAGLGLALGLGATPAADATPQPCGYVKYKFGNGPWHQVPFIPYCEQPCGGPWVQLPGDAFLASAEVFACVSGA